LKPYIPNAVPIKKALEASEPLRGLLQRIRLSDDRLRRLRGTIPATLHQQLRAGPADTSTWTILVKSPAVGAKLRQLLPVISAAIGQQEQCDVTVTVKVSR